MANERNRAQDAALCRTRAEQGDASAQFKLARMFYLGKGVPQDYTEAANWYRKSADQGYANAQFNLSDLYHRGMGVPQDYAEAFRWCRKAADQGNPMAQDGLAFMFYQGQGVPQNYPEAIRWYRQAADQGDAIGQDGLGFMYFDGKVLPKDYVEAARLYRKAADQGYSKAEYDLGYMYFRGIGVRRNDAEAARWFRKAAQQGDGDAQRQLAAMKIGFDTPTKVTLAIGFLGSILLLRLSKGDIRNRQLRRLAVAGLLGLLRVAFDLWGHSNFGILLALSAVNVFQFAKSLLSGILCAVLLPVVWPRGLKMVLTICATLFIGFNIYAMTHYDLRHFSACPRAFYSVNGLLLGLVFTLAMLLWLWGDRPKGTHNGQREHNAWSKQDAPQTGLPI